MHPPGAVHSPSLLQVLVDCRETREDAPPREARDETHYRDPRNDRTYRDARDDKYHRAAGRGAGSSNAGGTSKDYRY